MKNDGLASLITCIQQLTKQGESYEDIEKLIKDCADTDEAVDVCQERIDINFGSIREMIADGIDCDTDAFREATDWMDDPIYMRRLHAN